MAKIEPSLLEHLRTQLQVLKKDSALVDAQIAAEMERRRTSGKRIYQQKVSDFFSGEMKNPSLDFLALLCAALGITLSAAITAAERESPIKPDADWEWVMFGRRLGPERRLHVVKSIEGDEPPAVAPVGAASRPKRKPVR